MHYQYATIDTRHTSLKMMKDAARPWAVIRSDYLGRFSVVARYAEKKTALDKSRRANQREA